MQTIPRQKITEAWDRLCEMEEEEVNSVVKEFMEEQPALGIYLFSSMEDLEGGPESTPLIDLVILAWQVMRSTADRPLKSVSPEDIENAEEANTSSLEDLEEASEAEWENSVRDLVENYNQRELMGFGLEVLMSDHEENPELAPDSVGMEMMWLKTVIDCLDKNS